jgi:uncharacterized membrane protein
LQHFNGSFRSLVDELNGRWSSFVTHTYVTRQQRDSIKNIKLTSSLTTFAVIQIDFAENFSFIVQKEVQSAYWHQKQATVYTVVINIGANHRNMVIISNRMAHDTTRSGQPGGHNLKFDFPKFKYSNGYYIDWSIFH